MNTQDAKKRLHRGRLSPGPIARYKAALQQDSFAGLVLVLFAISALVWANSSARDSYAALAEYHFGPKSLGLNLSVTEWASDFLLALFFFLVGLELKQEFTIGSLRDPRKAAVPILAAFTGMAGPILVYCGVQIITGSGVYDGWAIPVATDIAFALGILAIAGKGMPSVAGIFLMTLAIADDLGGIIVIAIFFSDGVNFLWLLGGFAIAAVFGLLCFKRWNRWYLLWPLALVTWYCFFRAGVHATISAVLLGFCVPTTVRADEEPMTVRFAHKFEFFSAGVVLPIFAFFAAGVNIVDAGGIVPLLVDPVAIGIYLGLPLGKFLGICGGTILFIKLFKLKLGDGMRMGDLVPISVLAGIGFTVSLLIATLSFPAGSVHEAHSRVGVLLGTLLSVIFGYILAHLRVRTLRKRGLIATQEEEDALDAKLKEEEQTYHKRKREEEERAHQQRKRTQK